MDVKDVIRTRRIELGLTMKDVASSVGVSEGTVSRWESGDIENMKRSRIYALSKTLNLSPLVIMGMDDEDLPNLPSGKGVRIPVLGDVAAGIPIDAIENIVDYEEIDAAMAATGEFFGLRIKGSSMEPRIREGDVVIVRKQEDADTGDTAVVLVNGDSATVKRIKKEPSGISLIPNNPAYDTKFYSADAINSLPVRIIGKVVELRGKF